MSTPRIFLVLLTVAVFTACGGDKGSSAPDRTALTDTLAVHYYMLGAQGHYAEYVDAMLSCDSTTADYKSRMALALKHHYASIARDRQGVKRATVLRTEMHDSGRMANVFLNVTYGDGSDEEIIFPLVYDGQHWRIH